MTTTPRATARIQFFAGFTLDDAVPLVPYFAALGISHLYASPLLMARPGSTHCYDIVDHNRINPALGGEPALRRLMKVLRAHSMGLILDIVPNHMGVGGADNGWWLDLLEWGQSSLYAGFFDIDWTPPDPALHNKILAPFLGAPYGETLANHELVLQHRDGLYIEYHEHHFPITARSAALVLHAEPVLDDISHAFLQATTIPGRVASHDAAKRAKSMLAQAVTHPDGAAALKSCLARFDSRNPDGARRLHELLERQHYRLAWWRAASDEINWRRFFDINTLAGLRVERPAVFNATHRLILKLYAEGVIDGVRVDHIDGLANPRAYARKLRRAMEAAGQSRPPDAPAGQPYIVVEKILAPRERLPEDWQTDGTTGYDFMDQVAAVLHDPEGESALTTLWTDRTARPGDFATEEAPARRQILRDNLASELNTTATALRRIAARDLTTRDYTLTAIRRALTEILVHFPVYRIYAGQAGSSDTDRQVMDRALAAAQRSIRAADVKLLDLLRLWLADESPRALPAGPIRTAQRRAMVRFQQLSAPTAAKSVEDTAFYRFGRLLSRNEVGSNPEVFSIPPAAFHAACAERARRLPGAMLATATHDHKRGEDTRARLAVLSEIPAEWAAALARWMRLNNIIRRESGPSPADEIMLYQSLVGAWPLGLTGLDNAGMEAFTARVSAWQIKSIREAKLVSEWAAPNEDYEHACNEFLRRTLDTSRPILAEIIAFADRLGAAGAVNGLAQTLMRLTAPGVPDLYQGCEYWDQSLVDPDNRRPVDFAARQASLLQNTPPALALSDWKSGVVKQAIIARTLALRKQKSDLFAHGTYQKLEADGLAAAHILAFARRSRGQTIVTAVTRLSTGMVDASPLIPPQNWIGTSLRLPGPEWIDTLSNSRHSGRVIPASALFAHLPVALLSSP
ncbi:MAG: malto-oligosyltrehalose synthase [Acidocella sp.]|nr:malto-oligosyltrehalose synthase [Acidocella sp.]